MNGFDQTPYSAMQSAAATMKQITAPRAGRRSAKSGDKGEGDAEHGDQHADGLPPRQCFDAKRSADGHGQKRKGRECEGAAGGRRVNERRVEQERKERKEQEPKPGHSQPVATLGPTSAAERGERRKQQHADAKAKRADRERIRRARQIARGADRASAKGARQHRGQHPSEFAQPDHPPACPRHSEPLFIKERNLCDLTHQDLS